MKKLRLELNALAVESFEAGEDVASGRGTVRGRGYTQEYHYSACGSVLPCCAPSIEMGYCVLSVEVECEYTTNPQKDCWAPSSWPDCPA